MKKLTHIAQFVLWLAFFAAPVWLRAQGAPGNLLFTARLTGDQEVPAVTTSGEGFVSVLFSADRSKMQVNGLFPNLSGVPTAVHFHMAPYGQNGPVQVGLDAILEQNRLAGSVDVPPGFLQRLFEGNIYVNVHTAANPGGEIRGQLSPEADWTFAVVCTGLDEVPPVFALGAGLGIFRYRLSADKLQYALQVHGLSGPVTAAHIHEGNIGSNGSVVTALGFNGNLILGELDLAALPQDFISKMINSQYYVNIHTAANPNGEVRGQLFLSGFLNGSNLLSGEQENPPVNTQASGFALISPIQTLDSLVYAVLYDGLVPTAAHIHRGSAGINGPVVAPLQPTFLPGFYNGTVALTDDLMTGFLQNELYVNIHTATNPGGEIRGQLVTNLRRGYAFDLCGNQEIPANQSSGYGVGAISIDQAGTGLRYFLTVDGMAASATAAHIREAPTGNNGLVLYPLIAPLPFASGALPITQVAADLIETRGAYVNVNTPTFPDGELRGQIGRSLDCTGVSRINDLSINDLSVFPNPFSGGLTVVLDSREAFEGRFALCDVSGKLMWENATSLASGEQKLLFDLPDLAPGMYFLTLQRADSGRQIFAKTVARD